MTRLLSDLNRGEDVYLAGDIQGDSVSMCEGSQTNSMREGGKNGECGIAHFGAVSTKWPSVDFSDSRGGNWLPTRLSPPDTAGLTDHVSPCTFRIWSAELHGEHGHGQVRWSFCDRRRRRPTQGASSLGTYNKPRRARWGLFHIDNLQSLSPCYPLPSRL